MANQKFPTAQSLCGSETRDSNINNSNQRKWPELDKQPENREYKEGELPSYIRSLTLEDYFREKVTGSYAIKTIRNAWETSRDSFEISEKTGELRYNAGATWEADRILKELPETLEAHKSREWVVMNLEEAKEFFGTSFHKSWRDRFLKK